jgi:hypothetical protein
MNLRANIWVLAFLILMSLKVCDIIDASWLMVSLPIIILICCEVLGAILKEIHKKL